MAKIRIYATHGPEHPTRAALAFLVAKTAIDEGHTVSLFLAGDVVQLLRDAVCLLLLDSTVLGYSRYLFTQRTPAML